MSSPTKESHNTHRTATIATHVHVREVTMESTPTSLDFYLTRYDIGPLTTAFTPDAACTGCYPVSDAGLGGFEVDPFRCTVYQTRGCHDKSNRCYPDSTTVIVGQNNIAFYTPASSCPASWRAWTTLTYMEPTVTASNISDVAYLLKSGETALVCCPK